jgi:hypothetical protein
VEPDDPARSPLTLRVPEPSDRERLSAAVERPDVPHLEVRRRDSHHVHEQVAKHPLTPEGTRRDN